MPFGGPRHRSFSPQPLAKVGERLSDQRADMTVDATGLCRDAAWVSRAVADRASRRRGGDQGVGMTRFSAGGGVPPVSPPRLCLCPWRSDRSGFEKRKPALRADGKGEWGA